MPANSSPLGTLPFLYLSVIISENESPANVLSAICICFSVNLAFCCAVGSEALISFSISPLSIRVSIASLVLLGLSNALLVDCIIFYLTRTFFFWT